MEYVLRTFDLTKRYGNRAVVDGAGISIEKGEIYGFVGENGSGKTTVMRLVTGLIRPNGGSFELFGVKNTDPAISEARRKLGAVVESPSIYHNMTAYDNLKMQCTLLGIGEERIPETLALVGLEDLLNDKKRAGDFSLGMRQRLGIAMSIISEPEFLLLDEPMNGLDPAGIVGIRELILKLNRERGITFLISSHILTELSLVATKYGIISKGKIVEEITAEELHSGLRSSVEIKSSDSDALLTCIKAEYPDAEGREDGSVRINGEVDLNSLFTYLISKGVKITSVNCAETSFEEYYLELVSGSKEGGQSK